jgi:hypothetical protein
MPFAAQAQGHRQPGGNALSHQRLRNILPPFRASFPSYYLRWTIVSFQVPVLGGEPGHADVRAERKTADAGTDRSHPADNLVARHDRQLRIRQFAVDQVQIGAANAAGRNLNQDLALARPQSRYAYLRGPVIWSMKRSPVGGEIPESGSAGLGLQKGNLRSARGRLSMPFKVADPRIQDDAAVGVVHTGRLHHVPTRVFQCDKVDHPSSAVWR